MATESPWRPMKYDVWSYQMMTPTVPPSSPASSSTNKATRTVTIRSRVALSRRRRTRTTVACEPPSSSAGAPTSRRGACTAPTPLVPVPGPLRTRPPASITPSIAGGVGAARTVMLRFFRRGFSTGRASASVWVSLTDARSAAPNAMAAVAPVSGPADRSSGLETGGAPLGAGAGRGAGGEIGTASVSSGVPMTGASGRGGRGGTSSGAIAISASPSTTSATTTVTLSIPPCPRARPTSSRTACSGSAAAARTSAISSSETSFVRPSLQSKNRLPACASRSQTSSATSGSMPSARVSTWRCGWTDASSGVSSPWRTISSTTEWSSVSWRSL